MRYGAFLLNNVTRVGLVYILSTDDCLEVPAEAMCCSEDYVFGYECPAFIENNGMNQCEDSM